MAIEKTQSLENQIQKPSINDRLRKDNIQNRDAQTLINHFLKIGKQDWNTAEQQLQNWVKTLPSENRLRKFLEKEDRALNKLVGSRKAGLEKLVSALK